MTGETPPAAKGVTEAAITAWNSISDEHNDWSALSLDERETFIRFAAALSLPAPGEGEAGPWCQPMKNGEHQPRQFIVYYEDASVGIAAFDNEADARAHWEQSNINWNCYLFGAMPLVSTLAVKVKPIEWVRRRIIGGEDRIMSDDGYYWLSRVPDGFMVIGEDGKGHVQRVSGTVYPTEELAKAAAQAHYETRILSALVRP